METHHINGSDPIWDLLLRQLQLTGSISTLQVLLSGDLILPGDKVLLEYCRVLSTKEDGEEVLQYFGKLNQYVEEELIPGLTDYKSRKGSLPDSIEYIGKRPMDPLTFNYIIYERSLNKVDAVFSLYEPDRYYLKYWKYSFLRGLYFSSL
ncbi:MAG TPA: hypothetical protein ENN73_01805 [Firmicutes bacterium]|nr:hypothetical protein [Bacillota bacterium]